MRPESVKKPVPRKDEKIKIPIVIQCLCKERDLKGFIGSGWLRLKCDNCYRIYNIQGGSEMD